MVRRSSDLISDGEARVAMLAARVAALAETLGVVPATAIDEGGIAAALDGFARVGVGRASTRAREFNTEDLAEALDGVLMAIENSPLPELEVPGLSVVLGEDLLAQLVGSSTSSIHRYRKGERIAPDDVAARIHLVALVTADLAGSYNGFGIRRWFARPRAQLDGASPAEILTGAWSPDDAQINNVRVLAASLIS